MAGTEGAPKMKAARNYVESVRAREGKRRMVQFLKGAITWLEGFIWND
jgi:hypothetical protein